ncbi:MAG TPA: hypothetical protein VF094_00430 [Gaiellaceae bacterium]
MDAQTAKSQGGTSYEAPVLRVLGTVGDLTESGIVGKKIGDPDYMFHIPSHITHTSA